MMGRQIAIILGVAALLPLIIFYGVCTVTAPPKFSDFNFVVQFDPTMPAAERAANEEKQKVAVAAFKNAQSEFAFRLLCVAAPVGYLAVLLGGFMPLSALGTGLIFGGLCAVSHSYWTYWEFIPDWQRFVALLVAAVILALVALRKVASPSDTTRRLV